MTTTQTRPQLTTVELPIKHGHGFGREGCPKCDAYREQNAANLATMIAYQAGDEININGTTIVISRRKGSTGIRWNWYAPEIDTAGEVYHSTPEAAVDHARHTLGAERCTCGAVATMTASTRRTCTNCYDRYAA